MTLSLVNLWYSKLTSIHDLENKSFINNWWILLLSWHLINFKFERFMWQFIKITLTSSRREMFIYRLIGVTWQFKRLDFWKTVNCLTFSKVRHDSRNVFVIWRDLSSVLLLDLNHQVMWPAGVFGCICDYKVIFYRFLFIICGCICDYKVVFYRFYYFWVYLWLQGYIL